ncbi:MAG: hypothetical protein H0X39_18600, partial [Actinobacteria bacterium]|nr:hypothetical protein [Actinomycetota bacterium]
MPGSRNVPPVLSRGRTLAGLVLLTVLLVYYETSVHWWKAGLWWDVAWLTVVLIPAVFGLVLIGLPIRRARGLLPVGLAFA